MSQLYQYTETEPKRLSEVLIFEVDQRWSRQEVTLSASEADYPLGAVLALDEESGAYVHYLAAAGDSEAAAVLITPKAANSAAQKAVALLRGAVLYAPKLAFLDAVTAEEKETACARLTGLGLVTQE